MSQKEVLDPLAASTPANPDDYAPIADADALLDSVLRDPESFRECRDLIRSLFSWKALQSDKSRKNLHVLAVILREIAYYGRNRKKIKGLLMDHEEPRLPAGENPLVEAVQETWAGRRP